MIRGAFMFLALTIVALSLFRADARAQDDAAQPNVPPPILKIGSHAPDFDLPGVDGKMHALKDYASSKVLVVIFSCDHCPVAEMYEKRIRGLVSDYKNKGVAIVVIMGNDPKAERLSELGYTDVGDTFADMKIRAAYRHFNYPYLYDGDTQSVTRKYGPTATPHVFIFDQQRILRYQGRIDSNPQEKLATKHETRDAIDDLLAGRPVAVQNTPVVGCSTKWAYKVPTVIAENKKFDAQPVTLNLISAAQIKTLRRNAGTGKLLLLNVWATWCGPCVDEFPALERTVRMYGDRQVEFVTLSINDPNEKSMVLGFLQKQHAFNTNYIFNGNDASDAVSALGTGWVGGAPYTVLIGMNGEVLYRSQGEMDILQMRREILKNLPDKYYRGQHAYWNSEPSRSQNTAMSSRNRSEEGQ
ncbi:MAG: redoxin family protein [Acidobacteriaceae bacterium]